MVSIIGSDQRISDHARITKNVDIKIETNVISGTQFW